MWFSFRVKQFHLDIYMCRLSASLLDHFDCRDNAIDIENILKEGPTCCLSLAKLVTMHQNVTSSFWKFRVNGLGETIFSYILIIFGET